DGIIPSDITVEVSNDNSVFIRKDLGVLTTNGIQTTIIITIVLFLALGLKEGLLAGLAIPLSFLIAFSVMNFLGLTINSLSLFSLVIALGLMVDTAIIVMEGIFENMNDGFKPKEAALLSLQTYKWPLIAGTMTTVFAFFPMLLVSGIIGEFLKTLPITISATLLGSLIVSLTIIPAVSSKLLKPKTHKKHQSILAPIFKKLGNFFYHFIRGLINRRLFRVLTLLIVIILLGLSMALPATGTLKAELFPKTDAQYFFINIETPKGTILEETEKVAKEVEKLIFDIPEIESFLTVIGQSSMSLDLVSTGPSVDSNVASITVNLFTEKERERRSYEIADELREELKDFRLAEVTLTEISEGPPTDAAITVRITGENYDTLNEISTHIQKELNSVEHTENVRDTITPGLNEFVYKLDQNKLSIHGLSNGQVAASIRTIVQGTKAAEISLNNEDVDIYVEYDKKLSISEIENFEITTPKGYTVDLSELGEYEMSQSISSIAREDQTRIVKVLSDLSKEGNPVLATEKLQDRLADYQVPAGYEISYGGDLEEINESFMELYQSMSVGIILIAFCLVLMFNSFKQPFIIILSLPLALIGVFPGLTLIGQNLSFPAFLGVVALTGIVVNDSIVLIDRINKNRQAGIPFKEAIAEASNARLQPIIMTSITTIIGILPLALTNEFWSGLGFSLIFGLMFSTILTLIVIPVIYHVFEARKDRKMMLRSSS
ncbi:MMPL family transporter, partial [Candidatus Peregrinibacteria bacterium]|nr:MMPL family transporter [Candidatus Peregrinibacteria bacterium]